MERLAAVIEIERIELLALHSEQQAVMKRLDALQEDLQRHQDAIRLKSLGSVLGQGISEGHCPTCHQAMTSELLAQPASSVMALEENVAFLRSNVKLYEANEGGISRAVADRQSRLTALEAQIDQLRADGSDITRGVDPSYRIAFARAYWRARASRGETGRLVYDA